MQSINGVENEQTNSINAHMSPRLPQKTSSGIFGLLTKRSTKIEPFPVENDNTIANEQPRPSSVCGIVSFAKCTPDKKANTISSNAVKQKSQTLPNSHNKLQINLEKSNSSSGIMNNTQKKVKNKSHLKQHHLLDEGSQSDGSEVLLRKIKKNRSPNHNRFSHQFSLCCRAERKPLTPPVTVRYNSIPDATNALNPRRDNISLTWSNADSTSLTVPKACLFSECASAPESPVSEKPHIFQNSPSNSSAKSVESNFSTDLIGKNLSGPIRPIAVTACKSRLRLKLYPPGKELPPMKVIDTILPDTIRKATTPQHMSSPNIATQPDFILDNKDEDSLRFMSQENIQIKRQNSFNLVKENVLASSQVLNLITTEKARERSLLDGNLGTSSLLGPNELNRVLPNKNVTIFVGTWNMNGQNPPKQMNDFVLPLTVEHVPDIVAIGTQESSPDRFEWEVTIQETLGPSHVLFHSTTLGTLHLAVYMRRDLIWYCSSPEDAFHSVRTGTAFRTKGAVAIGFCLFGTSMLFVTSHLTAHQQKVKERVSDVKRIIHALDLPKNLHLRYKNKDVTQNFDNVFWCGDLNFRLAEPREKLLEWIQKTKFPLPAHLPHGYMHTDQLSSVLSDGAAFRGFMEANITFPPTYKYDPGTQHFDTSSKQRAPAYTDRILYKYRQAQGFRRQSLVPGMSAAAATTQPYVECLLYDSVPSILTSDHKPVWALFKTLIRAGTDSIPLAAGLFSRDIYLEGMRRRLNNKYSGSSVVCAIQ